MFVLYIIDMSMVVGIYSTLEKAKQAGNSTDYDNWCIIQNNLDDPPVKNFNNVYEYNKK